MLKHINLSNLLFLDIETVPFCPEYDQLDDNIKKLWDRKAGFIKKSDDDTPETLYKRAGIYAEFGKIICISVGFINNNKFRIKSFFSDNEREILLEFINLLKKFDNNKLILCAHNGKEFDFPYIARRILINGAGLPDILDISGKKPWEVSHLDTMELWKFGDFKSYTSLDLLATVFNIPTPKDDIDGSKVGEVYWKEKDLERIVKYCQKDVLTIAQLFLKYQGKPLIADENVVIV